MKWLQQNKLKLLQDYEDCLEPGEWVPPNPFGMKQFFAFTTSKSLNYRLMWGKIAQQNPLLWDSRQKNLFDSYWHS